MQNGTVGHSIIARKLFSDSPSVLVKFARDYWVFHRSILLDFAKLEVPACLKNGWLKFEENLNMGSLAISFFVLWSKVVLWQNVKKMRTGAHSGIRMALTLNVWHLLTMNIPSRVKPEVCRGRRVREGVERAPWSSRFCAILTEFCVIFLYSFGTKCTMIQWSFVEDHLKGYRGVI